METEPGTGAEPPAEKHGYVVVTGSGGGLGSAIVAALHDAGQRVIGIDRIPDPRSDISLTGDVGAEPVWDELGSLLETRSIDLSGLVSCAGESARTTIATTQFDDWRRLVDSNLTSTWLGMKACLPYLRRGKGAIVNIGSMYGRLPPPGPPNPPTSPAYQASKAGVVALTRAAAAEFGTYGIRVNCVEPGLFSTPLTNNLPSEHFAIRMRNVAFRRSGDTAELADVVVFLLSTKASYVNGVTIGVDGGYPLCL